jgi:two-component system, chemotaxis family, protein-glutamate methylesterase/glutaminase
MRIRCLIADDSPSFRAVVRRILERAPDLEVAGEAADGQEAVEKVLSLRPDVVTLDVQMPRLGGLEALREIMRVAPTPVVVLSAAVGGSQSPSFEALRLGAVEVLAKPRGDGEDLERHAEGLRTALRAVAGLVLAGRRHGAVPRPPPQPAVVQRAAAAVGIAASTGGPAALARILAALPAGYPLPVLVVQHIAAGFEAGLVSWLAGICPVPVSLAEDGERIGAGVHVCPDARHLAVRSGRVRLEDGPPVNGFKPSGTPLFASLAREYGPRSAGIVLSGMGDDGAEGLLSLRRAGGFTAAQGPASSVVYGMPRAALESGAAAVSVELDDVPGLLVRLAGLRARA